MLYYNILIKYNVEMNSKKFIEQWHDNFLSGNHDFLDNILDDNVVFNSPIVFKPIEGKFLTKLYLMAAGNSFNLEKFKYSREAHEGLMSVLEFETYIDEISVNGVDIIQWNSDGKIIDFKVMVRPLQAVNKVHQKMQEALDAFKKN